MTLRITKLSKKLEIWFESFRLKNKQSNVSSKASKRKQKTLNIKIDRFREKLKTIKPS